MSDELKVPTHVTFPSAVFDKVGFTLSALLESPEVDDDFKTCIKDLFEADSRGPYFDLYLGHTEMVKRVAALEAQLSQAQAREIEAVRYGVLAGQVEIEEEWAIAEYLAQRDTQKGSE